MSAEDVSLTFRPYTADDVSFLMDSWGNSAYSGSSVHKIISADEFHFFHRKTRERFFSKPSTAVIVCSPADDPWLIIGWIAVERIASGLILHYVYVKSAFRKQGIATELVKRAIPSAPVFFTDLTDRAARIIGKHAEQFTQWHHTPHLT